MFCATLVVLFHHNEQLHSSNNITLLNSLQIPWMYIKYFLLKYCWNSYNILACWDYKRIYTCWVIFDQYTIYMIQNY